MSAALLERILDNQHPSSPEEPRLRLALGDDRPADVAVAEAADATAQADPCQGFADSAPATADAEKLLENGQVRQWLAGKIPSRRNRNVFRAVVNEGKNQRDVAAEFGISQPRVNQILRQVGSWLSRVAADGDMAMEPGQLLQLQENIARMRYDHVYSTAMQLLSRSEASTTVERCRRDEQGNVLWTETTTKQNRASASLLGIALKSITDSAKFEAGYASSPMSKVGAPAKRVYPKSGVCGTGAEGGVAQAETGPYQPLSNPAADKGSSERATANANLVQPTACDADARAKATPDSTPPNPYQASAAIAPLAAEDISDAAARADKLFDEEFPDLLAEQCNDPLTPQAVAEAIEDLGSEASELVREHTQLAIADMSPDAQAYVRPRTHVMGARLLLRQYGYGVNSANQLMALLDPQTAEFRMP